jgi:alpha-beta hydrolase superfamily lysophospholipase
MEMTSWRRDPWQWTSDAWDNRRVRSTEVQFRAGDGVVLRGVYEEPDGPVNGGVLFLHGLNETRDEDRESRAGIPPFVQLAEALTERALSCLRFDFRGHGESELTSHEMTFAGETVDAQAALSDLQARLPEGASTVGLVAASFGSVAGFDLMLNSNVAGGVFWNPLIDVRSTFIEPQLPWPVETFGPGGIGDRELIDLGEGFALGKGLLDEMRGFEPVDPSTVRQPVLVIHGTEDTYVPLDASRDFAERCPLGEFLPIEGAGHGFGAAADREVLIPATTDWLVTHLAADVRRG